MTMPQQILLEEEVARLRDLLAQALSDLSHDAAVIDRLTERLAQAREERRDLIHQLACARGLNSALGEG
jgi:DNA-binding response OmpR family regulator